MAASSRCSRSSFKSTGVLLQSLSDIERDDTNDLVTLTASFLVLT